MKLQHIAAAVALVAAGTANAAIATGGNGSLVMIAYDKSVNGSFNNVAGVFDLGITLDDLVGSTGNGTVGATATSLAGTKSSLSWNFTNNVMTVNGATTTAYGANDWTAAWSTLLANVDASDLSFVVTAFDNVGVGAAVRSIVTGSPTSTANFNTTNAVGLNAISAGKANDIFTPIATKGTIGSAANGAYTFTTADGAATRANGYAMAGDAFGNEWRSNNVLIGETLASNSTALYLVDGAAKKFKIEGTLSLNAATGTLTLAVPEPTTYALLVSGLAVVGAVARRRRA